MSIFSQARLLACASTAALCINAWANESAVPAPAANTIAVTDLKSWRLQFPSEGGLIYRGNPDFDATAGSSGTMMYPAPNAAGLLVAIIAHGMLAESAKAEQKKQIQESADRVLVSYQEVLGSFDYAELVRRVQIISANPAPGSPETAILIESTPVFWLTQDHKAIILDNAIVVRKPGTPEPVYQNTIRVVSHAVAAPNAIEYWKSNNGEMLKNTSATLVSQSIGIALDDAAREKDKEFPFKTVRYNEGGSEKMERAQLLSATCDRIVIRNLRGNLMSVPPSQAAAIDGCVK